MCLSVSHWSQRFQSPRRNPECRHTRWATVIKNGDVNLVSEQQFLAASVCTRQRSAKQLHVLLTGHRLDCVSRCHTGPDIDFQGTPYQDFTDNKDKKQISWFYLGSQCADTEKLWPCLVQFCSRELLPSMAQVCSHRISLS